MQLHSGLEANGKFSDFHSNNCTGNEIKMEMVHQSHRVNQELKGYICIIR